MTVDSKGKRMPITREDVLKIAELARLELSAQEGEDLTAQLGSILDHISKLNELDTTTVTPMSHCGTASGDADYTLRDDLSRPGLGSKVATENAPDAEGGYFRVPKVIGG
jgi:aspartyl-tRNA(Asn)/glutamyl-tRNA(Gln) amidotransferase subunit C